MAMKERESRRSGEWRRKRRGEEKGCKGRRRGGSRGGEKDEEREEKERSKGRRREEEGRKDTNIPITSPFHETCLNACV